MTNDALQHWQQFNTVKAQSNYPQWPIEVMLKLVFGSYLEHPMKITGESRVLDVGCGFGNNLTPFLVKGCPCAGTEVTPAMAEQTRAILADRGFDADIRPGLNQDLPFTDNSFDLLLSTSVLHYEPSAADVRAALQEYRRVLAPGGRLFIMTVAPEHAILQKAERLGEGRYRIRDYDFRDGETFFCLETEDNARRVIADYFTQVEIGRVTEQLMKHRLDWFLITAARGEG